MNIYAKSLQKLKDKLKGKRLYHVHELGNPISLKCQFCKTGCIDPMYCESKFCKDFLL
jgi:hypothetical protein